jgi:hypothetical protein
MDSLPKTFRSLKKITSTPQNIPENDREGTLPNSSYKASITLIP